MSFRSLPFALLALMACGSGTSTSGNSSSGAGSPSVPVKLPDGTTVPTVACGAETATSASGTWDVVTTGSASSDQGAAVITIDATSFVFASSQRELSFSAANDAMLLTWKDHSAATVPIDVHHGGTAFDTGFVPLALGGQWTFTGVNGNDTESCSSSLSAGAFNATCTAVSRTPFGTLDGTVTGTRQQPYASIFGELGGQWHLTGSASSTVVDVTVSGNTFTAVVSGTGGPLFMSRGWVTIKACKGAAAGKTERGLEIAATQR